MTSFELAIILPSIGLWNKDQIMKGVTGVQIFFMDQIMLRFCEESSGTSAPTALTAGMLKSTNVLNCHTHDR